MKIAAPVKALDLILHGSDVGLNSEVLVVDYRDKDNFSDLWLRSLESGKLTVSGEDIDLTDLSKSILVIGNDPPDGIFDDKLPSLKGINFRSHFTATSWLAAWKVKFSPTQKEIDENGAIEACSRFAVIDPRPVGTATGVAQALQTIFAARDAADRPLVPGATILNAPSLSDICQWLKPAKPENRTVSRDASHLRDLLKSTIWNELTSKSEQHHAISNILGPVILSGKYAPIPPVADHKTLLRSLLAACGLVSWQDQKADDKTNEQSEPGDQLSILLLDDQAIQGWEDWVRECLPGAAAGLQTALDPTILVETIRNALSDDNGNLVHKDARFRLELPGLDGAATHPVLLLDLRLFSGNEAAEREFLKIKLLPLVNHFTDKPDLAWPGFSSNAPLFQRAKYAVETGTLKPDTDEHHEVLTWLPRVVALADMSLPIILFSSTGRRDLVEPFKPYGNIITSFEKPRLRELATTGSASGDIRNATITALLDAVTRARAWLTSRSLGSWISTEDVSELHSARERFRQKRHFEIFHDESSEVEKRYFRVSSLLAGFDDVNQANVYNSQFPIKFYGRDCEPKRTVGETEEDRWMSKIAPALGAEVAALFSVCARDRNVALAGEAESIFDSNGLDNINWDLLALLWECLLMDVLPALLPEEGDVSIGLYGATRLRPVQLRATELADAVVEANEFVNELRERWGLDVKEDSHIRDAEDGLASRRGCFPLEAVTTRSFSPPFRLQWRSLKPDSFWKLVAEICFNRRESPHYPRIIRAVNKAVGFSLIYDDGKPDRDRANRLPTNGRHLHYVADIASTLANVNTPGLVRIGFEPFTRPGSRGVASCRARILGILNANRLLDAGGCGCEALTLFHQMNHEHPKDLAYLTLVERLKKSLENLNGKDVSRFVGYIESPPDWVCKSRIQATDRIGVSVGNVERTAAPQLGGRSGSTSLISAQAPNLQRWRIRRFANGVAYQAAGVGWHSMRGFQVRKASNGKISVFADINEIGTGIQLYGFSPPVKNSFKDDGTLLGESWAP